ncbi:MAG: NAD-dependent epimerase/dehydratase family protein [Myxococcales bacterium]|nr:NAD-dependent epimerase/dehydratase family protein [Myxococcales bacterium]
MRLLVTGATGFIGQHVVRCATEAGHQVTCLVRGTSSTGPLAPWSPTLATGDITDAASLAAVRGQDAVIHLASLLKMPWDRRFHRVNAEGTGNVARACAEAPTPPALVVVSSLAAAGPSGTSPRTESEIPAPVSIYGRVKRAAEEAALAFADRAPITVVRPPGVFGEGDRAVLGLFRTAARGFHVVPGWRDRRMCLVHVDDLARALLAAAERGARADGTVGGGVYHVADPEAVAYADLGRRVGRLLGRRVRVLRLPLPLFWLGAAGNEALGRLRQRPAFLNLDKYREATAGDWTCNPGRAMADLGFAPPPLDERLAQTAADYQRRGWLT